MTGVVIPARLSLVNNQRKIDMKLRLIILQIMVFSSAFLSLGPWVNATDLDVTNFGNETPSTDALIEALVNDPPILTRSVTPPSGGLIEGLVTEPASNTRSVTPSQPAKKRSVSLGIQFKYNSFELTESARDVLNRLGGALVSPQLSEYTFMLEGHTDAVGTSEFNQGLSEKRAKSVKNYLVSVFGIDPSRLEDVGRGESALLDEADPQNSANRRVQIINLAQ